MAGTRLYEKGAIAEGTREGTQIDTHVSSSGFMPYKMQATPPTHITSSVATSTGGFTARPGMQYVSGVIDATIILPAAANHVGAIFGFRTTSLHNATITCSLETAGTMALVGRPATSASLMPSGSAMLLSGSGGDRPAAMFWCDGAKFHLMAGSGSFSGT